MDKGDIELLNKYFPFDVKHGFNGDISYRKVVGPYQDQWIVFWYYVALKPCMCV